MDSSFYLPIFLYFCGLITAFFSSLFVTLGDDDYKNLSSEKPKFHSRIHSLKFNYSDSKNPFFALELFSYLFATALLTEILVAFDNLELHIYLLLLIVFLLLSVFRTLFYAVGSNVSLNLVIKTSWILQIFMYISSPFNITLNWLHSKISRKSEIDNTLEELSALVETVCEESDCDNIGEYTLLRNVLNFKDVYVSDIMTPRTVIFSCTSENTISEVLNIPELQMYSRFPIRNGETMDDGVIGYALSKDVYRAALQGKGEMKIKKLSREIFYVPENSGLEIALDILLKKKQTMLLVVDEYGGIEGLLTMEDIVETILGAEILDEGDKFADLRELAKLRRDKRIATARESFEN